MKVEHPITTDMQVVKDNSGNSTCLELSKYHAKIRRLDISEYGSIPDPTDKMHFANKGYADLYQGWHGAEKIKILPKDFVGDDDSVLYFAILEDDNNRHAIRVGSSLTELYVFVPIPTNYKATEVQIYANNSDTVTVYEENIDVDTYTTLATSSTNTAISIDLTSSDTNYLGIQIAVNSTADYIYGGYVTIERV